MTRFEVSARMKVRDGQLEGFKRQAAECVRQTKEKDTRTLRYDLFLKDDGTEAEFREEYVNSDGFLEHRKNIGEALNKLFSEFADAHTPYVFGDVSPELVEYATANMPAGSVDRQTDRGISCRRPLSSGGCPRRRRGTDSDCGPPPLRALPATRPHPRGRPPRLGLSIVRAIAIAHDATLTADARRRVASR